MTLEEIQKELDRPDLPTHHRRVLEDVKLEMRLAGLRDSTDVDKQVLVTLIQKEPIK